MSHANACLTPKGRLKLARCVVEDGWSLRRAADKVLRIGHALGNRALPTVRAALWESGRHPRHQVTPPASVRSRLLARAPRGSSCSATARDGRVTSPPDSARVLEGSVVVWAPSTTDSFGPIMIPSNSTMNSVCAFPASRPEGLADVERCR